MGAETRPDSLWRRLVWPVLWPLLLAEGGLIGLCIIAWLVVGRSSLSSTAAWQAHTWPVLAWGLGTSLIIAIFLVLLRHRLHRWEVGLGVPYDRLERLLREVHKELPSWLKAKRLMMARAETDGSVTRLETLLDGLETLRTRLTERPRLEQMLDGITRPAFIARHDVLVDANAAFERLSGRSLDDLRGLGLSYLLRCDDPRASRARVRLNDGQGAWHVFERLSLRDRQGHELGILDPPPGEPGRREEAPVLSHDPTREASQLKSSYLRLLQQELEPIIADLSRHLEGGQDSARRVSLRERLADLSVLAASLSAPEPGAGGEAPTATPVGHRGRVLVVDDGPVSSTLARNVLEAHGFEVQVAENGERALSLGQRQPFDLVFMDIFMPPPDGVETCRRWRASESVQEIEGRSVLVALTANAGESECERFQAAGMDDCLAKPYRPQALIEMAERWLSPVGKDPLE